MENTLVDVQGLYYNNQSILNVGDGDLLFSSPLATRFGVASNIVATSLDSRGVLIEKYGMDAIQNITNLTDRGALVIHSVDVRNMAEKDGSLPLFASGRSLFDVVTYNFPHAGFFGFEYDPEVIRRHTELMQEFFRNAALLLAPGGVVYVAHKCGPSYDSWNLGESANTHGLLFVGSVPFQKSDFPGYTNRRGSGKRAGETFELGKAAIYKFALRCGVWIENNEGHRLQTPDKEHFLLQTLRSLRSLKKFRGASLKTPLLPAIAAEVARLEKVELGPKKQRKLISLKVVAKAVPLLVKTLAIHQIQSLQPSRSYNKLAKSWSRFQKLALEAIEDEQSIVSETLEQDQCGLLKEEPEVMEIYVSDDIANGALAEETEEAFRAFVLDTPTPCSMDAPEDTHRKTDHGIRYIMAPISVGNASIRHGYQSCDDNQSDMPGLKGFRESSADVEDVHDKLDGLEGGYFGERIINWVNEKILCCGMTKHYKVADYTLK